MKTFLELYDELNEKPKGLYYYINKKRKEGRKMRKKGEKGAPKASDFERAAQTAKENVQEGPEEDEAREAKRNAVRGLDARIQSAKDRDMRNRQSEIEKQQRRKEQEKARKERETQTEEAPSLAVLKKKIKSGTKLGSTETASAKARGLIPRADGTKRKSPKYK
jgi:septum formation inhibitor MinC